MLGDGIVSFGVCLGQRVVAQERERVGEDRLGSVTLTATFIAGGA
jgi:hypothetical protein